MGKDGAKKDFKHRKQKVGKKKLAPANETKIDVKFARLDAARAEASDEEVDGAAKKQISLKEALQHTRHHNTAMRKDALHSIGLLVQDDELLLQTNASSILPALAERFLDTEPSIRGAFSPVLTNIFSFLAPAAIAPHLPIVSVFLTSALTKLAMTVRLDALSVASNLLSVAPRSAAAMVPALLPSVASLLEPQLHAMVSPSLLANTPPPVYEIGSAAAPAASASSTGRRRLTGVEARLACTYAMRRMLLTGNDHHAGDGTVPHGSTAAAGQGRPLSNTFDTDYVNASTTTTATGAISADSATPRPSFSADTLRSLLRVGSDGDVDSVFAAASSAPASTAAASSASISVPIAVAMEGFGQLLQLWLECGPGEAHAAPQHVLHRLALCAHTMRLLIQRCPYLQPNDVTAVLAFGSRAGGEVPDSGLLKAIINHGKAIDVISTGTAATAVFDSAAFRLVIRALQLHVFPFLPIISSKVDSRATAASGGGHASNVSNGEQAAVALLNTRLAELVCAVLPDPASVHQAQAMASAVASAPGAKHSSVNDDNSGAGESSNKFAVLTPRVIPASSISSTVGAAGAAPSSAAATAAGSAGQQHALQQNQQQQGKGKKRGREHDQGSASTPFTHQPALSSQAMAEAQAAQEAAAHAAAWRAYLKGAVPYSKALKAYSKVLQQALSHVEQGLATVESVSGRGMEGNNSSNSAIPAVQLLPAFLPLLEVLLPHAAAADPARLAALFRVFNAVYSACPPKSRVKGRCLAFIGRVLRKSLEEQASASAPSLPGSGSGHVQGGSGVASLVLDPSLVTSWLQSFPRLLWTMGSSDLESSQLMLELLHAHAVMAAPMGPLHMSLRDCVRQMAPLVYTTKPVKQQPQSAANGTGSSSTAASSATSSDAVEVVFGPFLDYPAALQSLLLSVVHSVGHVTPSLKRALAVVARHPRIDTNTTGSRSSVRSQIIETTVLAMLAETGPLPAAVAGADSVFVEGAAGPHAIAVSSSRHQRLAGGCADATSFIMTVLLGRSVEPSVLAAGPQLLVAPHALADRGDQSMAVADATTSHSRDVLGVARLCGAGSHADGGDAVYSSVLACCASALRLVSGRARASGQGAAMLMALNEVVTSLTPPLVSSSSSSPAHASASAVSGHSPQLSTLDVAPMLDPRSAAALMVMCESAAIQTNANTAAPADAVDELRMQSQQAVPAAVLQASDSGENGVSLPLHMYAAAVTSVLQRQAQAAIDNARHASASPFASITSSSRQPSGGWSSTMLATTGGAAGPTFSSIAAASSSAGAYAVSDVQSSHLRLDNDAVAASACVRLLTATPAVLAMILKDAAAAMAAAVAAGDGAGAGSNAGDDASGGPSGRRNRLLLISGMLQPAVDALLNKITRSGSNIVALRVLQPEVASLQAAVDRMQSNFAAGSSASSSSRAMALIADVPLTTAISALGISVRRVAEFIAA